MRLSLGGALLVIVLLAILVGGSVSGAIPVLHTWWEDLVRAVHGR